MADLRPFFISLLQLACFIIFPTSGRHRASPKPPSPPPLLRVSPTKLKRQKSLSSYWSFVKRIFSSKPPTQTPSDSEPTARPSSLNGSPLRNDIHPCLNCGEVFQKPGLLEQHRSLKHTVCEFLDDDPGKNVVRIIFETGWPGKNPMLYRVMKIHNSPKILNRFEEYRESVKAKAARQGGSRRRAERCLADGNELLRFYCTTYLCDLGQNGHSSICSHPYCSVCGIIGSGFSPKLDGISTLSTSWRAHVAIPEETEEEFGFMNVKRAMLVCRVIAGRVGCDEGIGEKEEAGYDCLVGREAGTAQSRLDEEDELIVFNPRAVLPCFVIGYSV